MPDFASRLWTVLGYGSPLSAERWEMDPEPVPAGQHLRSPEGSYFPHVRGLENEI
jgi:hypothetical protein